ncbi:FG-GAP-like repeat-containing protein, partial [Patescibacteria group bacterium]
MDKTKIKNKLQKIVAGMLVSATLFVQMAQAPIASAQFGLFDNENDPTKVTSLIAILVDEAVIEDNTQYEGLIPQYSGDLSSLTLRDRISRFAKDTQVSDPFTKSLIIRVNQNQTPYDIAQALETLYYKGDETETEKSQLEGVITIGDVPLPVVNKKGYKFVSMLPYTDFEEKSYVFNLNTKDFEYNDDTLTPKAEAWHGVIKPSREGAEGKIQLSEYFDKNHLYHIAHPDFSQYDEKPLYADMIWESSLLDQTVLKRYENYAAHLEDFAYHRYTKALLEELTDDPDLEGIVDPEMFEGLPDAHSRTIILNYAVKFNELFKNYLQKANDLVKGSGRWEEYDSIVELIAVKDLHTQEYLKQVNDQIELKVDEIAETLQSPFSLVENSIVSGMITLDNNNNINLNSYSFINNNKFLEGGFFTIHYYGKPGIEITDPKECTLYRGNTQFNRLYNPDATDASDYGGCYADHAEKPERCFTDLAIKELFDENGGVVVENVPLLALTYAGCFDFREQTRFDDYVTEATDYLAQVTSTILSDAQKDALPLPESKYRPAEEIILFNNPQLTFKDVLDMYGGFDGEDNDLDGLIDEQDEYNLAYKIDADNPYEIGINILGNQKNQHILENPPFAGIKKVKLNVSRSYTPTLHTIPSITYHKEPTIETIQTHLEDGTIDSMPVNDPRLLAFQDQNFDYQEVIYPNSFKKADFDEFLTELEDLEERFMNMPGYDPNIIEVEGAIVDMLPENDEKVIDAIEWLNYTIDQKHAYAVRAFLDKDQDSYIGETENGYEYFYITAEGDSDSVEFALDKNPDITDNDPEWLDPDAQADPEAKAEKEAEDAAEEDKEDIGRPLMEWFVYIVGYLTEIAGSVSNINFQPSCGEFPVFDLPEDMQEAMKDENGDGIPDGAENSVSIRLSFEKPDGLILTGGMRRYEVEVSVLDGAGNTNLLDSFTQVQLVPDDNGLVMSKIEGADSINVVNGRSSFYIKATQRPGDFNLSAQSTNRPDQLLSNILNLKSEARKVKVYTYELETVEPPSYTEEVLKNYIVKGSNGETVAEIDANTGKITITDPAYGIEVLESQADKRMRIAIIELRTGNILASVVLVPDEGDLEVHDSSYSFEENATTLAGVHVKDIRNDYIITYQSNDSIYLLDNSGIYSERIARITNDGDVFLAEEHFIIVKNPDDKDAPYIFIIEDGAGNNLAEFHIGYRLGSVIVDTENTDLLSSIIKFAANKAFAQSKQEDDSDGDGLTDLEEVLLGTNRIKKDSDGDGFGDGEEMQSGYDPLKKDLRLFVDLNPQHPSYQAFAKLLLRGVIEKAANNTVRPLDLITREEYVRMVLGITCVNCSKFSDEAKKKVDALYINSPFPDQDVSAEFNHCVKEAKNEGIVSGYAQGVDAGYFKPLYNISRAEAVKVILEAAGIDSLSYYEQGKPWYYRYVLKAQSQGIFPKQGNPALQPLNNFTETDFKNWIDTELSSPSNVFETFIISPVTRAEFALMVQKITAIFDCYGVDQDGDGLPDNLEIYQYNTSTTLRDTDQGGLDDLSEVIAGKDPLDPSDDSFLDSDGDGMPDNWEDEYGFDKFDPDDALFDSDVDGLINLHEYENETDPRDPDTDDGGTQDGDEVWLQDTDPLYDFDDYGVDYFESGINAFGSTIEKDTAFQLVVEGEEEQIRNYIDNFTADGVSTLYLAADVLDDQGDVVTSDNDSIVEFFFKDSSTTDGEFAQTKVKVQDGTALNTLTSTTKAGLIDIDARLVTGNLPVEMHQVFAQPQEPVRMEIQPRSDVIKTGGLSKTQLSIVLYDENDNIANNDFFELDIDIEGPGVLDKSVDNNLEKDGIQLQTFEGIFKVDLFSNETQGDIAITAALVDKNITAQNTVLSREGIGIEIIPERDFVRADGLDTITIQAKAVDSNDNLLSGFNEDITFSLANENLGAFNEDPKTSFNNGLSAITFTSSKEAGLLEVTATSTGLDPGSSGFYVIANEPYELRLETNFDTFDSSDSVTVEARAYDQYGNFVQFENSLPINFRITDATSKYGEIVSDTSKIVRNGIAQAEIAGKGVSGEVHLIAQSPGLKSGTLSLLAVTKVKGEDLIGENPNALYGTMLGGSFGDTTADRYTAGEALFKGTVQAVTALTVKANPNMPLSLIGANGGISMTDDSPFEIKYNPPGKILIRNPETDEDVAQVYYVYPEDMTMNLVEFANTQNLSEGIFVIQKTEEEIYDFKKLSDSVGMTIDGNEALRVTNYGGIQISDSLVTVEVSDVESPFLVLSVNHAGSEIAQIIFAQNLYKDAEVIKSLNAISQPGIYIKALSSDYDMKKSVSGSSTKETKGILISDKELTVVGESAPGFSYSSLEKIHDVMGIGFDGDNKHSLFFAGGSNVGVSNIPYASEIGINFGDPTVRLGVQHKAGGSGFGNDIGEPIYFGDESVKAMVLSDYNNDSLDDIILAYESGKVRLLQRQLSARPYKDKGLLLDLANGIFDMASADFNNDGYDDLLISTKDPCVGDEVCFYLYENNEGAFTRTHLDLDLEDKVSSIKIGDLNNDDYPDIVLAEFSGN